MELQNQIIVRWVDKEIGIVLLTRVKYVRIMSRMGLFIY